mmetsp:Transcript_66048/g.103112  ORF Transcript_66048/g.103112 Transcript_66048/m.103112 type:complete len:458 (+) Transcript_66048:30-1403(+)
MLNGGFRFNSVFIILGARTQYVDIVMAPKKKQEEKPPPQPEELLPNGYSLNCNVFWIECPEMLLGESEGFMVRPGSSGKLVAVPDMVEVEKEDGEKEYYLEVVEIAFGDALVSRKVPLKSIALTPPPQHAIWNLRPLLQRTYVKVTEVAPTPSRKVGLRKRATPSLVNNEDSGSPYLEAINKLQGNPRRADRMMHLLEPSLVDFLSSADFEYSSNQLGNHAKQGWITWQAIYPWIVDVLKAANLQGRVFPELSIDHDNYEILIKTFDKEQGSFIGNCPATENILPFGKFVVTLLYLESQEIKWKRAKRESEMKEVLERDSMQDGDPRVSVLWDTEDDLDLHICLPGSFGEINFREQYVSNDAATMDDSPGMLIQPLENVSWPNFDALATGKDAELSPPIGEYRVWLHMSTRRSTMPCYWACQVTVNGQVQSFCGTWQDGDRECIDIATVSFSSDCSI